jgi:hypothetical protein
MSNVNLCCHREVRPRASSDFGCYRLCTGSVDVSDDYVGSELSELAGARATDAAGTPSYNSDTSVKVASSIHLSKLESFKRPVLDRECL